VKVAVIYESMGGNTKRAAEMIGGAATFLGAESTVMPVTDIDLHALATADLVFVGSWTDGLFFFGQRPGRAGRFQGFPWIDGKRVATFCTYAVNPGQTVQKLGKILTRRGADVIGGKAIKRTQIDSAHVAPFVAAIFEEVVTVSADD
jgi:flavodoxin